MVTDYAAIATASATVMLVVVTVLLVVVTWQLAKASNRQNEILRQQTHILKVAGSNPAPATKIPKMLR